MGAYIEADRRVHEQHHLWVARPASVSVAMWQNSGRPVFSQVHANVNMVYVKKNLWFPPFITSYG